jgi:predicted transcriptional regulator
MQGTIKEIAEKHLVNGVRLTPQEWYSLIRLLERAGNIQEVAKKKNAGAGRQSRVFNLPDEITIRFKEKQND